MANLEVSLEPEAALLGGQFGERLHRVLQEALSGDCKFVSCHRPRGEQSDNTGVMGVV